jgi:hypothetical protein
MGFSNDCPLAPCSTVRRGRRHHAKAGDLVRVRHLHPGKRVRHRRCDFALGAFSIDAPIKEGARKIVCTDWFNQNKAWEQQRWAYLFYTGLISEVEAEAWADEVWPSEKEEKIEGDAA